MLFRTLSAALATLLLGAAALTFTACDDDDQAASTGKLNIAFENVVGTQALVFGSPYTTLAGDQFTVNKFNYLISNVKLTKADGSTWAEPESYHLVKQSDGNSRAFTIDNVPAETYSKVIFTIGVDSARNSSGAQTGALAQDNDMYWNWNSGYIFLKLEGTASQSPTGVFTYHVGEYRRPYNSLRTVTLPLPSGTASLQISADKTPTLHLKADVLRIFAGPKPVRLAQMYRTSHDPRTSQDSSGVKLAMNYAAGMFHIDHVAN